VPELKPRQTSVVEVVVKPDISPVQISEFVDRLGGLVGCRHCGLLGIDLRFRAEDPDELELGGDDVAGVSSVVVSAP
jgi:hypothetical protein